MRPTYIASVYRPPDGNLISALNLIESKVIDIHSDNPGDIVLLGDMNVDLLNQWDPKMQKYLAVIKSLNLTQIIKTATRAGIIKLVCWITASQIVRITLTCQALLKLASMIMNSFLPHAKRESSHKQSIESNVETIVNWMK